jgi:hypothetical protein
MFPKKLKTSFTPTNQQYMDQLSLNGGITQEQLRWHLNKLSPYKATRTDEIPSIVLKKCTDLITPYLLQIYRAVFTLQLYIDSWHEIITCILRKLGKPKYNVPKSYRPIAMLNTIAKLFTSIVAEEITHLVEAHQLLPDTHFGGCLGRTTTNSLHLLTDTIKAAWCRKQVVSVLFLDIKEAFPNMVTDRLLHNMRKRRVPETYVRFMENLLTGRRTKLIFNDYTSDWFELDNGIGQGDPLSMILYLFYNANFLNIMKGKKEKGLGYVDEKILVAIGVMFADTHRTLGSMMTWQRGGFTWSKFRDSAFETKTDRLFMMENTGTPNSHPLRGNHHSATVSQVPGSDTRPRAALEPSSQPRNCEGRQVDSDFPTPGKTLSWYQTKTHETTIQCGSSTKSDIHSRCLVHPDIQT